MPAVSNRSLPVGFCCCCREGGIGEAVLSAVADQRNVIVKVLAVPTIPRSGPPTVLIDMFGISARHIVSAALEIVKQ